MAENRREQSFGIGAGQGEFVGVADPGRLDFDQPSRGPPSWTVVTSSGLPAATATAARTSMAIPHIFDLRLPVRSAFSGERPAGFTIAG